MKRLKELRKDKGITQEKLSKYLGVARSTISMWESGDYQPDNESLVKLADYFTVSTDYLLEHDDHKVVSTSIHRKKGIKIPVLGLVQAGIPVDAIQDIIDYEEITEEMSRQGDHFGLRVTGSSMEPRMLDGDVVIVRKQNDVDSGSVAIVLVDGENATVKQITKHEAGLNLISYNPLFPPMFYSWKEVEEIPVTIIGKVIELRGKF